jgi:hypothetical protein
MLIRGKQVIPDKRKGLIQLVKVTHLSFRITLLSLQHRVLMMACCTSCGKIGPHNKSKLCFSLFSLYLYLLYFQDLIIFPGDAVFKRVKQCTTGRVYLLEWKTSDRRLFFWMQEPSDEKDEEYCTKINHTINNPPQGGEGTALYLSCSPFHHHLGGSLDQSQLLAMMGGSPFGMGGGGRRGGRYALTCAGSIHSLFPTVEVEVEVVEEEVPQVVVLEGRHQVPLPEFRANILLAS